MFNGALKKAVKHHNEAIAEILELMALIPKQFEDLRLAQRAFDKRLENLEDEPCHDCVGEDI